MKIFGITLFKNLSRMDCRCCGAKLHKPGGWGIAIIGHGFCAECAARILILGGTE